MQSSLDTHQPKKTNHACCRLGDMAEAAGQEAEAEMRRKMEAELKLAKSSAAGESSGPI